jgi:Ni/Co efflux regulator RcnB
MKTIILGATIAALTLSSGLASAQPYRDSDRDGRPDWREWNRDRDRDGRPDQWDRHDRRHHHRGYWRQGQVYPHWRDHGYWISDYRAYGLAPPRAGYRYYRDDNGDVVMAAIASGVIGAIIGGALADDDDGHHYRHR